MTPFAKGGIWISYLAAVSFALFVALFGFTVYEYAHAVEERAQRDVEARAAMTALSLAEPLRTLDFRGISAVGDRVRREGLELRIQHGSTFSRAVKGTSAGFYDTGAGKEPCLWGVVRQDDFSIGVGRPLPHVRAPIYRALVVAGLAALVGVTGVLLFFFVAYRQRVRIRELTRLEKFRREFVTDVSHEIKTPLTGILGAVDLLEGALAGNALAGKLLAMLRKESTRLNALVQQILDLARLEREGEVLERLPIDLGALVRETVDAWGERMNNEEGRMNKCGVLCAEVPEEVPPFVGDARLLSQALDNLIGNALRHSGSPRITVRLSFAAGKALLAVEDEGIGIPPEEASRVFERFHRVDPARAAETGGAGLGLAIVQRIARLHGGEVRLEAVKPHGCRFIISLPLIQPKKS